MKNFGLTFLKLESLMARKQVLSKNKIRVLNIQFGLFGAHQI
jgi:hypothetical protein